MDVNFTATIIHSTDLNPSRGDRGAVKSFRMAHG